MNRKILTFVIMVITSSLPTQSQPVTIMDFNCDDTQSVRADLTVAQRFTMPSETDYYVTQLGVKLDQQSAAAEIKLAIYNSSYELIFVSAERHYPGSSAEILTCDIAPGVVSLSAENSYMVALIHNGSDFLYLEKTQSASNEGVASVYDYSHFFTDNTYANFPQDIDFSGAWETNLGFYIQAEEKITEITPDNEILEFNTVSQMTINHAHIYSILLQIPDGESHDLRQIGLKKNAGGSGDQIQFAVYNNNYILLHQTDPVTIEDHTADTIFAAIPAGTITLHENTNYHIAFQYDGSSSLDVELSSNPIYRGIATIYNDVSRFSTDQTFTNFPDPLEIDGAYEHAFGFVLNGDAPVSTNIQPVLRTEQFNVYPVPAKSSLTLTAKEGISENLRIDIFDSTGKKILNTQWIRNKTKSINTNNWAPGIYFISITDFSGNVKDSLKIMKQ